MVGGNREQMAEAGGMEETMWRRHNDHHTRVVALVTRTGRQNSILSNPISSYARARGPGKSR